ncbi:MAG: hypothetical protein KA538_06965 [Azonexus sp.]|jgi:hypothetical protein|nr:hypothetical protein [Azonexus sp.]
MKKTNSFVDELHAAMPTPQAQLLLVACLAKYAGQTIYIPTEPKQARRVRAATNMLANGMRPADISAAIVCRFNVSQRTAERDVQNARNFSEKNDAVSQ